MRDFDTADATRRGMMPYREALTMTTLSEQIAELVAADYPNLPHKWDAITADFIDTATGTGGNAFTREQLARWIASGQITTRTD